MNILMNEREMIIKVAVSVEGNIFSQVGLLLSLLSQLVATCFACVRGWLENI
jgi:hypothetical protein